MQRWTAQTLAGLAAVTVAFAGVACSGDGGTEPPDETTPRISAFTATPTSVPSGGKVTLAWTADRATTISIAADPGGSVLDSSPMLSGTVESGAITADTTFTLTATGEGGKTATRMVSVTVSVGGVQITKFEASPNPGPLGGSTTLSWETAGATSVRVLQGATELFNAPAGQITAGTYSASLLQASTTFTLVAGNGSETAMETVTVTAEPAATITSFDITPRTFSGATADVTVTWATMNATGVQLLANGAAATGFTPNVASGTVMITVSDTTTFELVVTGGGTVRESITVTRSVGETEPNDDQASATPLTAGAAAGTLATDMDLDWYSVQVGANGNITAETSDGMGGCSLDTIITLFDSAGTELAYSDDDGIDVCSLIDPRAQPTAASLAAGTYYIEVRGYSGAVGDYALTVIVGTGGCGNGILETGEDCDDGNTTVDDGCSMTCELEVAGTINPPGGEVMVTIDPQLDRLIEVNITTAGQTISATALDTNSMCTIDTALGLFDGNIELISAEFDDPAGGPCAEISQPRSGFAANLEVGRYYVGVLNESPDTAATILVDITITDPVCGNGIMESLANEQCDDGNATAGDGCNATCQVEVLGTLMGPPGTQTFNNAIDPASQADYYQVVLTAEAYLTAETFAPMAGTCTPTTTDTVIELLGADLTQPYLQRNDEQPGAGHSCAGLRPTDALDLLMPGTYHLRVTSWNGSQVIPSYALTVTLNPPGCGNGIIETGETCDDGNTTPNDNCSPTCQFEGMVTVESEPNNAADATADATGVTAGQSVILQGAIDPLMEVDYWSFTVAGNPAAVKIQTHTNPADATSCDGSFDTRVELLDSMGNVLEENDDADFGILCSLVDGTNAAEYPMAAMLAPGTYYVSVRHWDDSETIPLYYMTVSLQ